MPVEPIRAYLASTDAQAALPEAAYVPESTEFEAQQIYNQLEKLGELPNAVLKRVVCVCCRRTLL